MVERNDLAYLSNRLTNYGIKTEFYRASILANIAIETGSKFIPLMEGNIRANPNWTEEKSIRAVKRLFDKGVIRTDYSEPTGPYLKSYFGRGYIQLTWYDNYLRISKLLNEFKDLVKHPELLMELDVSSEVAIRGMWHGWFTGRGLKHLSHSDVVNMNFAAARRIVNGDYHKIKTRYMRICNVF